MKQGFIIYTNTYPAIKDLTLEEKGLLLETVFLHELGQPLPTLSPTVQMAFNFIKISLENDTKKYEVICERNRINGEKGGRPKTKPKKPSGLSGNPKNPDAPNINININKNIKETNTVGTRYLNKWNEVFGKAYVSTKAIESNLNLWLSSYKEKEILEAIGCIKRDKYWGDKDLSPEWLLRTKEKGEPVDRIGRMLNNEVKSLVQKI